MTNPTSKTMMGEEDDRVALANLLFRVGLGLLALAIVLIVITGAARTPVLGGLAFVTGAIGFLLAVAGGMLRWLISINATDHDESDDPPFYSP